MKNSQIVLILNGSYIGRMEETVLGYPAPLSGRRTVQYLLEPLGSIWPLSDLHAKLAANYIIGNYNLPTDIRKRIAHHIQYMKRQYINSPRHTIEVEYHKRIRELTREIPKSAPAWESK